MYTVPEVEISIDWPDMNPLATPVTVAVVLLRVIWPARMVTDPAERAAVIVPPALVTGVTVIG